MKTKAIVGVAMALPLMAAAADKLISYDSEKMKGIAKGLRSASGYLRRGLAEKLNLRITPELTFVADSSAANGAHIASLLEDISREAAAHEPENPGANESEE